MTEHKNIYVALAAAQAIMKPAIKDAKNPHFNSKYADLAGVVEAVRAPLTDNGISWHHYTRTDDHGRWMVTAIVHGATDTRIECPVELIVGKNDMQGYKSATTYAKRIGLESVTGLPTDDDDGNAAAQNPPAKSYETKDEKRQRLAPQINALRASLDTGEVRDDAPTQGDRIDPDELEPDTSTPGQWVQIAMARLGYDGKLSPGEKRKVSEEYARMLVERAARSKPAKTALAWINTVEVAHQAYIAKLPDDLRTLVEDAFAEARDRATNPGHDPADFAPIGTAPDPIVLGEIPVPT